MSALTSDFERTKDCRCLWLGLWRICTA